eukprot:1068657-Pyramimonas_sp.AAC.1
MLPWSSSRSAGPAPSAPSSGGGAAPRPAGADWALTGALTELGLGRAWASSRECLKSTPARKYP